MQLKGKRCTDDFEAFESFKSNHPTSHFSHQGYIQYQGSDAQELLLKDIEDWLHETLGKKNLWGFRCEYYEQFPLNVFRDKINQEIRTAKYLHTLKVKGKQHRAS